MTYLGSINPWTDRYKIMNSGAILDVMTQAIFVMIG